MKILRWIAIVPAALLAPVLVLWPVHWLVMLTDWDEAWFGLVTPIGAEYVFSCYAAPIAMSFTAWYIAPIGKYEAALVAIGVWATLYIIGLVYTLVNFEIHGWMWVRIACMTIATGIAISKPFTSIDSEGTLI